MIFKNTSVTLKRPQTPSEEKANALSHGFGLVLALIGTPFLIVETFRNHPFLMRIAVLLFCLGILMVYSFSTAYHSASEPKVKARLQVWDHISIYFLIAGSYSPMLLTILNQKTALIFLALIWGSVCLGTFFKIFFTGKFKLLSVVIYLTMGWLAVFFLNDLIDELSLEVIYWIAAGGLSYTLGVYFYIQSDKLYYHTIWHIFVLMGTVSHFVAIAKIV